jgi:hypothetical protein
MCLYQALFSPEKDAASENEADAIMYKAWREKETKAQISLAEKALTIDPKCVCVCLSFILYENVVSSSVFAKFTKGAI